MTFYKHLCASAVMVSGASFGGMPAVADVTITQQTSFEVASFMRTHGSKTTTYTGDKKREDSENHCEGVLSIVCGNVQGGEIVRLDRGLTWHLEPKKKRYTEQVFATPEQIAAIRAQLNANLEKMKSCPTTQKQQPDQSKCQMSPPKFDVRKTGDKATLLGHASERTLGTLTESCTNKDTGDVCDTVVAVDVWLTQDSLPGVEERRAFDLAYAKKLGLDDPQGLFSGQMAQYLARYQAQITELSEKAKQFKGQALKTSFRVLAGGPHCASAKQDAQSAGSDNSTSSNAVTNMSDAGKAVGKLMGNLFKKKQSEDTTPPPSSTPTTPAATEFPQMTQLLSFTVETTALSTEPVAPTVFDIPSDWTKEVPPPAKAGKDEFSCPKSGT